MQTAQFYIAEPTNSHAAILDAACNLIADKYSQTIAQIFLYFPTENLARKFDELLWATPKNRFLPHQIYKPENNFSPRISLGYPELIPEKDLFANFIIYNFSQDFPPEYQNWQQLIEIVYPEPELQAKARERYKTYRNLNIELTVHKNWCD